jgi:hypothetical protein
LQSLRASQQELEALNASILSRNRDLQAQLDRKTRELDTAIASSSSSSLLNSSGGVTHITATLDFDLSQLTGVQVGESVEGSSTTVHHASAVASVPLKFNSLYCSTMEEGLSTIEDPGMRVGQGTGEEDELDKDFWIRRSGELSLQLQQSSDYWSQKVRELSIQLEKQQQQLKPDNRHTEFSD